MTRKKKNGNGNGVNGNGACKQLEKQYFLLREFKPKTENQASYVRSIAENDIVLCTGPAGTGKTCIAVALACEYLVYGKVNKIVITRPVIETGRGLGYLPGDFQEKIHPYLLPIYDEMNLYFGQYETEGLKKNGIIEIAPLGYMRGRNFHNAFMILDEAQNATLGEIKMFLTRIGRNSKCVLNGDIEQSDLRDNDRGLQFCMEKLKGTDGISCCELTEQDIIRNSIISRILSKLR